MAIHKVPIFSLTIKTESLSDVFVLSIHVQLKASSEALLMVIIAEVRLWSIIIYTYVCVYVVCMYILNKCQSFNIIDYIVLEYMYIHLQCIFI